MNETDRDLAYNLIDRFLRNELDDKNYAEYSSALEQCFTDELLIQQLASRDAEVATLREQVTLLRSSLLASANYIDALGGNSVDSRRNLAATEHHASS